ncbi:hypothetical protein [Streptococcus equi]|uniref:Uncharacterized protein n=1 Tax=Streptococcus equi subsp. ruminatorum TaxID=254358 RepID=A0A6M1KJY3_9STRE|nr:hypothetical protein [Streptococcus equi]NGL84032.1 hypothetical protein [Streptococcus equi subsp. ruminatorum]
MNKKQITANFSTLPETDLVAINGGNDFLTHVLDIIIGKVKRKSISLQIMPPKY